VQHLIHEWQLGWRIVVVNMTAKMCRAIATLTYFITKIGQPPADPPPGALMGLASSTGCFIGGSRTCKQGDKVKRCRRENRRAEGSGVWEGCPPPHCGGIWKGAMPPPQNIFWFWISKCRLLVHSGSYILQFSYLLYTQNTAFGLRKFAAACKQTAKYGKASLLETIRGL